jgi:hypothetical protein
MAHTLVLIQIVLRTTYDRMLLCQGFNCTLTWHIPLLSLTFIDEFMNPTESIFANER